jgi:pyruvate/2-oxoglutarate dehydrogenase complex dihydrolipoamide dehydrogenase (E3) component
VSDAEQYDAIIIGAGQGGMPLTTTLAGEGWRTALVEREHVGGTCINTGCTPTKTMVASARAAYMARRASDYGIRTGPIDVDMTAVRQRKRDIVQSFRQSSVKKIEQSNAQLIRGEAHFAGTKELKVDLNEGGAIQIAAEHIFIDTGARPRIPDVLGLDTVPYLNSTTIMELGQVPEHLLIIGGGYVGVEFAQMFRRFGSQVTIVQRSGQLLTHEDGDVADEVAEILRQDGIEILLGTVPVRAGQKGGGQVQLVVRQPGEEEQHVSGSHLLVAAGRVPNTEALNLDAAGIETDSRGYVNTNDRLETNVSGIYALGDVKGGPAFTHISYDDYRIVRSNLLEGGNATIHDRPIPYTVFIDPQLGRIGLTEEQARGQDLAYRVARMPMDFVSRALEIDQTRGFMKALVDPDNDQILGCAILGVQGGEIMAILEGAMMGQLPYTALRDGVFTHPTLAESLNTLFTMFEDDQ